MHVLLLRRPKANQRRYARRGGPTIFDLKERSSHDRSQGRRMDSIQSHLIPPRLLLSSAVRQRRPSPQPSILLGEPRSPMMWPDSRRPAFLRQWHRHQRQFSRPSTKRTKSREDTRPRRSPQAGRLFRSPQHRQWRQKPLKLLADRLECAQPWRPRRLVSSATHTRPRQEWRRPRRRQ